MKIQFFFKVVYRNLNNIYEIRFLNKILDYLNKNLIFLLKEK